MTSSLVHSMGIVKNPDVPISIDPLSIMNKTRVQKQSLVKANTNSMNDWNFKVQTVPELRETKGIILIPATGLSHRQETLKQMLTSTQGLKYRKLEP